MTKRTCPFEIGVLRQFKIHINNFDHDKASREDVQNKTIEKLFAAQKHGIKSKCIGDDRDKKKQFEVKEVSNLPCKIFNKKVVKIDSNMGGGSECCFYCDGLTNTIYTCNKCSEQFCHSCSFADYLNDDDGRICLTCS